MKSSLFIEFLSATGSVLVGCCLSHGLNALFIAIGLNCIAQSIRLQKYTS